MKDTRHKNLSKKITLLTVAIILAAVVTLYLASPLFISTEVNEPFPPNSAALVSFEKFSTMTEEQRTKAAENMSTSQKTELMIQYANSDSNTTTTSNTTNIIDEAMSQSVNISKLNNSLILGSLIGVNDGIHNAEGTAKIIPLQKEDTNVLRLEDLKVTNGPDLYVYLSTDKSASDFVNL
ncbi:MAG: DM13 domain-containing protein, partial [Thermoproteota archaeon]|nr:DM13 domain-containing protein [Thermoproteota archaeon]